jgi:hypothetical protein
VRRAPGDEHAPGLHVQEEEEEDVQHLAPNGLHGEDVTRHQPRGASARF